MDNDSFSKDIFLRFSALLKTTREEKKITQSELARRSHVALRTIVNLESPSRTRRIRYDVVVRLATALEIEPQEWLELTGHHEILRIQIDQVLKKFSLDNHHRENTPDKFFSDIQNQLSGPGPIIFCVCFRTSPSNEHQAIMINKFVPLLESGKFYLSLVCPYPRITKIEAAEKSTMANFYLRTFSEIIRLTKAIKAQIKTKYHQNIATFSLNLDESKFVIMPTLGLSEFRPIFIQSFSEYSKIRRVPDFRLVGWLSFLQDERNRIINIFPDSNRIDNADDMSHSMCLSWREYLTEIIDSCDFENKSGWKKASKLLGCWQMIDTG